AQIASIEHLISYADLSNEKVSQKGIDWHLDHTLKVIIQVSQILTKSDPKRYKWRPNIGRFLIINMGIFPRGRAKAPKSVNNKAPIDVDDLWLQLEEVKKELRDLDKLPAKAYFKHPYLGRLDLRASKRFLTVHTRHHLKIIQDILK
ncbi:MAG: hypothetical protein ACPGXL_07220, partial [Chitinophagales bacterium]